MYEAALSPEARAARGALRVAARAEVDRILALLEINPWTDGVTKFTVVAGDMAVGVYDDGRWEVAYRVVDDRFIEVIGINAVRG